MEELLSNLTSPPAFVGPHEGCELELMEAGRKPLSMFVVPLEPEFEYFPEERFDSLVADRKLIKHVSNESITDPHGQRGQIRRVLYALPGEEWRINAILLVQNLYDSLSMGWRPDLERIIGLLLGYSLNDIELYVEYLAAKHGKC